MDIYELEKIEFELLIRAIEMRYGYNFEHYKKASLMRSIKRIISKRNIPSIAELIPLVLKDETLFNEMLCDISIPVTDMFRDPHVFLAIREKVIPILKTYPFVKIWHAGCASGEEVYSLAIMLQEEGLYDRVRMYGTDINVRAISHAKEGIFSAEKLDDFEKNYLKAGGKYHLHDYFNIKYKSMIIDSQLKRNTFFFSHNLASDQTFGEMHMVLCRNVIIYFDNQLQTKVIHLFDESLCFGGFLCLGTKESLVSLPDKTNLIPWLNKEKIYRKQVTFAGG